MKPISESVIKTEALIHRHLNYRLLRHFAILISEIFLASLQAQVRIYFKTPQVNCRSPILNVDFILRK